MRRGFWTLAFEVAKWLCQNSVIRSRSGCGVKIIRYSQMRLDPRQIGRGRELGGHRVEGRFELGGRRAVFALGLSLQEPVDAGGRPVAQVALEDRPGSGKSRATVQVRHARQVPRSRRPTARTASRPSSGSSIAGFCMPLIAADPFCVTSRARASTGCCVTVGSSRMTSRPWPR